MQKGLTIIETLIASSFALTLTGLAFHAGWKIYDRAENPKSHSYYGWDPARSSYEKAYELKLDKVPELMSGAEKAELLRKKRESRLESK